MHLMRSDGAVLIFNDFELLLTTRIIVSGTSREPASHAFTARQL